MKTTLRFFALTLFLASTPTAWAGTYNFYFNNAEQGDNGTAAPSVVVKDGEDAKSDGTAAAAGLPAASTGAPAPAAAAPAETGPAPASLPDAPRTTAEAAYPEILLPVTASGKFRLIAGANFGHVGHTEHSPSSGDWWSPSYTPSTSSRSEHSGGGAQLGISYYLSDYLVGTVNLGYLSGVEAEFCPIWTPGHRFELALTSGISGVAHEFQSVPLHFGIHLTTYMGPTFGLSLSARRSLSAGDMDEFTLYEAGVAMRF